MDALIQALNRHAARMYREQAPRLKSPNRDKLADIAYAVFEIVAGTHGLEEHYTDLGSEMVRLYETRDGGFLECVMDSTEAEYSVERFRKVGFRMRATE
jgi:hypothetical protein